MELDRGTLARIDRKLLAWLGQDETFQMVRVPATAAKWSPWKRYCDAAGISMGRAIMALIERELVSVFVECTGDEVPVFASMADEQLAARQAQADARESEVKAAEERIRSANERLRVREGELDARDQRTELVSALASRPTRANAKIGRNEQCPCGSGSKYKRCHGLADSTELDRLVEPLDGQSRKPKWKPRSLPSRTSPTANGRWSTDSPLPPVPLTSAWERPVPARPPS